MSDLSPNVLQGIINVVTLGILTSEVVQLFVCIIRCIAMIEIRGSMDFT